MEACKSNSEEKLHIFKKIKKSIIPFLSMYLVTKAHIILFQLHYHVSTLTSAHNRGSGVRKFLKERQLVFCTLQKIDLKGYALIRQSNPAAHLS